MFRQDRAHRPGKKTDYEKLAELIKCSLGEPSESDDKLELTDLDKAFLREVGVSVD